MKYDPDDDGVCFCGWPSDLDGPCDCSCNYKEVKR